MSANLPPIQWRIALVIKGTWDDSLPSLTKMGFTNPVYDYPFWWFVPLEGWVKKIIRNGDGKVEEEIYDEKGGLRFTQFIQTKGQSITAYITLPNN